MGGSSEDAPAKCSGLTVERSTPGEVAQPFIHARVELLGR